MAETIAPKAFSERFLLSGSVAEAANNALQNATKGNIIDATKTELMKLGGHGTIIKENPSDDKNVILRKKVIDGDLSGKGTARLKDGTNVNIVQDKQGEPVVRVDMGENNKEYIFAKVEYNGKLRWVATQHLQALEETQPIVRNAIINAQKQSSMPTSVPSTSGPGIKPSAGNQSTLSSLQNNQALARNKIAITQEGLRVWGDKRKLGSGVEFISVQELKNGDSVDNTPIDGTIKLQVEGIEEIYTIVGGDIYGTDPSKGWVISQSLRISNGKIEQIKNIPSITPESLRVWKDNLGHGVEFVNTEATTDEVNGIRIGGLIELKVNGQELKFTIVGGDIYSFDDQTAQWLKSGIVEIRKGKIEITGAVLQP